LPETLFVRDIDNRVFQGIVLQTLSKIKGISLIEGNIIDSILGRNATENIKGIHAEQDNQNHTLHIRIEVNICYGISIPEKAEEIQSKVVEEVTRLSGLHVSTVHVVFKNVIPEDGNKRLIGIATPKQTAESLGTMMEEDYNDEF
jgi:uncharacterized alkaline shock family protein YloU